MDLAFHRALWGVKSNYDQNTAVVEYLSHRLTRLMLQQLQPRLPCRAALLLQQPGYTLTGSLFISKRRIITEAVQQYSHAGSP